MILTKTKIENTSIELLKHPECEWIEFKEAKNTFDFNDLGKYFSAISNEANLKGKQYGWLIFGVRHKFIHRKVRDPIYGVSFILFDIIKSIQFSIELIERCRA